MRLKHMFFLNTLLSNFCNIIVFNYSIMLSYTYQFYKLKMIKCILELVETRDWSRNARGQWSTTSGRSRIRGRLHSYGISLLVQLETRLQSLAGFRYGSIRSGRLFVGDAHCLLLGKQTRTWSRPQTAYDPTSRSDRQQELRFGVQTAARRNSNASDAETR